jgi:hypothetical protein
MTRAQRRQEDLFKQREEVGTYMHLCIEHICRRSSTCTCACACDMCMCMHMHMQVLQRREQRLEEAAETSARTLCSGGGCAGEGCAGEGCAGARKASALLLLLLLLLLLGSLIVSLGEQAHAPAHAPAHAHAHAHAHARRPPTHCPPPTTHPSLAVRRAAPSDTHPTPNHSGEPLPLTRTLPLTTQASRSL